MLGMKVVRKHVVVHGCEGCNQPADAADVQQAREEGRRGCLQAGSDLHGWPFGKVVSHTGSSGSGFSRLEQHRAARWDIRAVVSADE